MKRCAGIQVAAEASGSSLQMIDTSGPSRSLRRWSESLGDMSELPVLMDSAPANPGEITAHHQQRRERLTRSVESLPAMMHRFFDIALAGSDHAKGDTGFREAHRCPFGASKSVLARMTSSARFPAILSSASIR